ncbi:MAG TPA: histidine--tRNA ligase [Bdellovibrionota bacterium]|nr:histidine--tRNA ligase [Bdellovibrionota bacterium]
MFNSLKGMEDILPADAPRWLRTEEKLRNILLSYGYAEIRTPLLEETDLFARSIGASTDVIEKEMFSFKDQGGASMSLRPEGTASVVRAYVQHHLDHGQDLQKVYYLGPMFRHERPQKGRLRQFHQLGIEAIGSAHPLIDVEVMAVLVSILEAFEVPDVDLQINSVGDPTCRPAYRKNLQSFLKKHTKELCENCRRRVESNPFRVLDCKNPECQPVIQDAPKMVDELCEACGDHFVAVQRGLEELGLGATVNPRIVRGLDYYTRTSFEVTAGGLGAQNAIGAGGRYDGLTAELGGADTPAIGFAMGIERLLIASPAITVERVPRIDFLPLESAAEEEAFRRATETRKIFLHKNVSAIVDVGLGIQSLKSALRKADKNGTRWAVLIGGNELKNKAALVKDLVNHQQEEVKFSDLAKHLLQHFK